MLSGVLSVLRFLAEVLGFIREEKLRESGRTEEREASKDEALEAGEHAVKLDKDIRKSSSSDLASRL